MVCMFSEHCVTSSAQYCLKNFRSSDVKSWGQCFPSLTTVPAFFSPVPSNFVNRAWLSFPNRDRPIHREMVIVSRHRYGTIP